MMKAATGIVNGILLGWCGCCNWRRFRIG
jgi:hypothetical protein